MDISDLNSLNKNLRYRSGAVGILWMDSGFCYCYRFFKSFSIIIPNDIDIAKLTILC